MLIDTHAHLDFDDFAAEREAVIERACAAGVDSIINIGINCATSEASIQLAAAHKNIYATVGIHPHEASRERSAEHFARIRVMAKAAKVVALGEIGLDYYRDISPREDQQYVVREFLQIYRETGLPLVLHARESYDDLFSIIRGELGNAPVRGVMHCFSGDQAALETALELGLYISFTGPVTYKKNDCLRSLVARVPDERLLLETDCPYLAPQSVRGKRNEPMFLAETAACVASVRNVSPEDIARITRRNSNSLFGVPVLTDAAQIVYKIRDSLYINTTTGCTNECVFCVKFFQDVVKGHDLRIKTDPSVAEVLRAIDAYSERYNEVTFCGFGEPLLRLDFIKEVARALKEKNITVRIDTNGHGNLIHKRNILPELEGLIDEICVSLNVHTPELYAKICRPSFSGDVYTAVKDFIREAKRYIPRVVITFLDMPDVDIEAMKQIARDELGVEYRLRHYNVVG
jgi:TatD DNase family protein